jgi:hypothetical protein
MELERIVLKALAKERADRYQHGDELLTDLRTLKKQFASSKEIPHAPLSLPGKAARQK